MNELPIDRQAELRWQDARESEMAPWTGTHGSPVRSSSGHPAPTATRRRPTPGERAGATVETWHVNRLIESPGELDRFPDPDDSRAASPTATTWAPAGSWPPGSGPCWARRLRRFHDRGGLVLGICNGFQVLVRSGLLPGGPDRPAPRRWLTTIRADSRPAGCGSCPGRASRRSCRSPGPIELPVAHGEGRVRRDPSRGRLRRSTAQVRSFFSIPTATGQPTQDYPANPNGSAAAVAGVCDPTGRIFGLMPHPERFIDPVHHPRWTRQRDGLAAEGDGLRIFKSAVLAF